MQLLILPFPLFFRNAGSTMLHPYSTKAMGIEETAGFIQSIKATAVKGGSTEKYVEVYPHGRAKHGNDRKGDKSNVRYATIGFVAEYGTSSQQARPYMTVANEKAQEKVVEAQLEIWERETNG